MDSPEKMTHEGIRQVAVLGAGTMGSGIAFSFARNGLSVSLYDIDDSAVSKAQTDIRNMAETLESESEISEEEVNQISSRIKYYTSLPETVRECDFVTEAVVEDIEIKQKVFKKIAKQAPDEAILATNTSGLSITEIADSVENPSRVVGTHWFNPPHIVPLVEVIHGDQTHESIATTVHTFLDKINKTPVMVKEDIPGFIGNRIQMAMMYEAFSLLEQGVADPAEIDRAVKAGFGFRLPSMGIFEKADQSGLDVHHDVESYLMSDLDRGTDPNPVVSRLVENGDYGLKSGQGVYDWENTTSQEVREERDKELLAIRNVYKNMLD